MMKNDRLINSVTGDCTYAQHAVSEVSGDSSNVEMGGRDGRFHFMFGQGPRSERKY